MKKTLFAMLALATMMPAIAFAEIGNLIVGEGNWELGVAFVDPYESYTDYTKYTLYLMKKENSDLTSVQTMLEETTFSDFTTTIASGDGIAFEDYEASTNQIYTQSSSTLTEFSTTLTPQGNIWGVCVYQNEDVVRFQVLEVADADSTRFGFETDTDYGGIAGSGYTTFGSGSPTTPEPATATLSLLALAGLATRRRRK